MQLQTQIPIATADAPISHDSRILSLGSCFAENMSGKLVYFGFRNAVNPFGILFHPVAIETFLRFSADGKQFDASDIFTHNERWHCFDAHSELSNVNPDALLSKLNGSVKATSDMIADATHIIITLGTAWMYRHIGSGKPVANCHKVPQSEFSKELLSVDAISASVQNMIGMLSDKNPNVQIIFTISPVRHLKDGFVGNQRSKSHLISGLHPILDKHENCHYFPSYEIAMDELRDYRFYAADMIHPNQIAIDYIWERFAAAWISESSLPDMKEIDSIRKALAHRPFDASSNQHMKFLSDVQSRIDAIKDRFPFLVFE